MLWKRILTMFPYHCPKCMKPLKGRNNKIKELKLCRMMIFWREGQDMGNVMDGLIA